MESKLILGVIHKEYKRLLMYNNDFDASDVRRMYLIENLDTSLVNAWQRHKIEQRWFTAVKKDSWNNATSSLSPNTYILDSKNLNVLHIPSGYISCIQSTSLNAKLLVLSNYLLDDANDEYRYESNYFVID